MSDVAGQWCLIESDPGVFTELIKQFGHEPSGSLVKDSRLDDIFFAQQVIQNACATQAIINLLLNCEDPEVHVGPILSEFKGFTSAFDPANRGLCLSNSDQIRKVHNSFARQTVFDIDVQIPEKEDVYHFITYLPVKGRVYELDGLQEAPIDIGRISEEGSGDWLDVVRPIIEEKIKKYSEGEIHFNLMAVISDRRTKYQKRLKELAESENMDTDATAEEIYRIQTLIAEEEHKLDRYKAENIRRKHNYVPFIMELLKILAREGKLVPLVKEAKEKAKQRAEEEKKKEKEDKDNEKPSDPAKPMAAADAKTS